MQNEAEPEQYGAKDKTMDKNKRGLTKAQSQAAGLTGDAKRKAAVKLRADRAKQEAARKKEAERKAAEKTKMKMVDRAVLLGGSVKVGAGIGNKLADRSIKTSTEKIRQAMKDKALKQNSATRRGDMMARVGKRRAEEILKTKKPVNRKDGSPKTGEEIIAYEKETHTKYNVKSPLETGKEMMKAQAERNAKNTYPRRRRGVGKAVKGFGKALP